MRSLLLPVFLLAAACGAKPAEEAAAPAAPVETSEAAPQTAAEPESSLQFDASGLPKFRPGLWEVTKVDDGETEVSRECVGEETNKEMAQMLAAPQPNCTREGGPGLGAYKVKYACSEGGISIESDIELRGGDTNFDMKMGIWSIVNGERNGGVITAKGKWVSACPAGMKPGDTEGETEN